MNRNMTDEYGTARYTEREDGWYIEFVRNSDVIRSFGPHKSQADAFNYLQRALFVSEEDLQRYPVLIEPFAGQNGGWLLEFTFPHNGRKQIGPNIYATRNEALAAADEIMSKRVS